MISKERFCRRFTFFLCLSGLGLFLVALRLYYLQVDQHAPTLSRAERQYTKVVPIQPQRGVIWDRRRRVLALSMNADSIFARPAALAEPTAAARLLSKALELPPEDLRLSLTSKREFVWVRRKVTPAEMDRVRALALEGIGSVPEAKRFYPKGPLAGQLLGFVGMDEEGLSGVEHALDLHLRGVPDRRKVLRDALGRTLLPPELLQPPGVRGSDVVLALDESVQHIAEKALAKGVLSAGAASGTATVMEVETGEVLALAEFPPFDPNQFPTYGPEASRVRSAADAYEPGSTFKVVTAAAYLEGKGGRPEDTFYCEGGRWLFLGRVIQDVRPYGNLTVREILEHSSNIGIIKMAQEVGPALLERYIQALGFGERSGSGLSGESAGIVRPLKAWTRASMVALPMGQEIAVTPLQLVSAYAAVANGGYLMLPRVVKSIERNGGAVRVFPPKIVRRALGPEVAETLREILRGAVERGTGKKAAPLGYTAGGKTGTAQQVDPSTGSYRNGRYVASFVGFAPAERPRVVILVTVDSPRGDIYGGSVAAPIFREIAGRTLLYLRVPGGEVVTPGLGEGLPQPRV